MCVTTWLGESRTPATHTRRGLTAFGWCKMGGFGSKHFLSHFSQEEVTIYEACTCLDGAELANIYEKFISMGGRRVTKGAEEARFRHPVGQKTVRNMQAGADVALTQVPSDSAPAPAADASRRRIPLTPHLRLGRSIPLQTRRTRQGSRWRTRRPRRKR